MRTRWTITKAHAAAVIEVVGRGGLMPTIRSGWMRHRVRMWWSIVKGWNTV